MKLKPELWMVVFAIVALANGCASPEALSNYNWRQMNPNWQAPWPHSDRDQNFDHWPLP